MSLAFVVYFSNVASHVISACLLQDAIYKEWALPGAVTLEGEYSLMFINVQATSIPLKEYLRP